MANVTFDGATKIIQVDAGITSIDVQEVYSEWKRWVRTSDNAKWLQAFDVVGGDDLGGGLIAPIYFFLLNGWTVRPDDTSGSHELEVSLNLYARPVTNARFTPVSGVTISNQTSDSAITNIELLEYSSFQNRVTVDAVNGTAGTAFPQGTPDNPVDNVADAMTIATERGFTTLYFIGDYTFDGTEDVSNQTLQGQDPINTTLTFHASTVTDNEQIRDATVSGTIDTFSLLLNCHIAGFTEATGSAEEIAIHDCVFEDTGMTIASTQTGQVSFFNCKSNVAGQATPFLDLNGTTGDIIFRDYTGGIELRNWTGAQVGSMDFISGQLVVAATCDDGTLTVRGRAKVTDNSTGTFTINDETSNAQIAGVSAGGGSDSYLDLGGILIGL